jgi:choline transporter-like protein 2/4/5
MVYQQEQTDADKNNPDNEKLKGNADFKGPGAHRGCTDILCALMLIACWFAMTVIGLIVTGVVENDKLPKGDPARLINGMDYTGAICGVSNTRNAMNVSILELPKAYYLPSGAPVCIAECPTEDNLEEYYCKYNVEKSILQAFDDAEATAAGSGAAVKAMMSMSAVAQYECMPLVATRDVMGYCVPEAAIGALTEMASAAMNAKIREQCQTDDATSWPVIDGGMTDKDYWLESDSPINCTAARKGIEISADFLDPASEDGFFDRANADLYTTQWLIIGFGCGVAMTLGFVYLWFIKIPGVLSFMVWGLITAIWACFVALGGYMYLTSEKWKTDESRTDTEVQGILYLGYFILGLGGLWTLFICCIRKRIKLAVGCVKEAAKSIEAMPIIVCYPVFQVIGVLIFLMPWMLYMTYLASGGTVVVDCICPSASGMMDQANSAYASAAAFAGEEVEEAEVNCEDGCFMYKTFDYTDNAMLAGLYMLFSWFWTSQFVIAAGQLVVAMSVSTWYFTRDKKTVNSGTFIKSAKKAMWYHLGTAAFGSLIIAIIKTIRVIISYLQHKFRKSKNVAIKALLCAIQCYMWCIEKCMKFLNKNAYIQTAIFGYSFCKAARKAFFLILRNILRISAVAIVSSFVLIIGKLFIMIATTLLAYMFIEQNMDGDVNYIWIPTILVCFISYFTAEMFNEVFGMAISTILQCFVADEEMFEVAERFAEGDLASMIGKTNAAAKKGAVIHPEADAAENATNAADDGPELE